MIATLPESLPISALLINALATVLNYLVTKEQAFVFEAMQEPLL